MNKLLAKRLAFYLTQTMDELTEIKVCYFIESVLNELEKLIVILLIFAYIKKMDCGVVIIIVLLLLRVYIGGYHCNTYIGCLVYSIIMCFVPVILNEIVEISQWFWLISEAAMAGYILLLAPLQNRKRPVYSRKKRRDFKIMAMLILLFSNVFGVCFPKYLDVITITHMVILLNSFIGEIKERGGGEHEGIIS